MQFMYKYAKIPKVNLGAAAKSSTAMVKAPKIETPKTPTQPRQRPVSLNPQPKANVAAPQQAPQPQAPQPQAVQPAAAPTGMRPRQPNKVVPTPPPQQAAGGYSPMPGSVGSVSPQQANRSAVKEIFNPGQQQAPQPQQQAPQPQQQATQPQQQAPQPQQQAPQPQQQAAPPEQDGGGAKPSIRERFAGVRGKVRRGLENHKIKKDNAKYRAEQEYERVSKPTVERARPKSHEELLREERDSARKIGAKAEQAAELEAARADTHSASTSARRVDEGASRAAKEREQADSNPLRDPGFLENNRMVQWAKDNKGKAALGAAGLAAAGLGTRHYMKKKEEEEERRRMGHYGR